MGYVMGDAEFGDGVLAMNVVSMCLMFKDADVHLIPPPLGSLRILNVSLALRGIAAEQLRATGHYLPLSPSSPLLPSLSLSQSYSLIEIIS